MPVGIVNAEDHICRGSLPDANDGFCVNTFRALHRSCRPRLPEGFNRRRV